MSDEQDLLEALEGTRQVEEPYKYPFLVGKYDEKMRDRIKARMPSWLKLANKRKSEFKEFDYFLDSAFFSLWKPTHTAVSPLTKSAEAIKKVLDIAQNMPEWYELKRKVENDPVHSALATMVIGEHIQFPDEQGGGGGEGNEDGEGDQDAPGGGVGQDVRDAIAQAVKAAKEASDNADAIAALWGEGEGEHALQDPETLLTLTKTLSDSHRLRMISRMLGRLKNQMYRSRMTRSTYVPEEFVDVTLGNELDKLLPNGLLYLSDPELEPVFLVKYLQRALLQQVKEGTEPEGQGPIVVMIDISGSMGMSIGEIPGVGAMSRIDWALAVGLTLTILAKQQNRDFYIGLFDWSIRKEIKTSDGPIDSQKLVEMLSFQAGGGTNFQRPLQKSLDIMEESEFNKADIVFVTDGECYVDESFLTKFHEVKQEKEFKVLGVACEHVDPASLKGFCDRVLSVANVLDADAASNEIFSIGAN